MGVVNMKLFVSLFIAGLFASVNVFAHETTVITDEKTHESYDSEKMVKPSKAKKHKHKHKHNHKNKKMKAAKTKKSQVGTHETTSVSTTETDSKGKMVKENTATTMDNASEGNPTTQDSTTTHTVDVVEVK
ncbi:MAG: hypothetical protein JWM09_1288 [Francisellaceae bacterium]|nr:hypothetical protein [Francisellaceae bacterium]